MKSRIVIFAMICGLIPISGWGWMEYYKTCIPNKIQVITGSQSDFDFSLPASASIAEGKQQWTLQEPFSVTAWNSGSYEMEVRLFGVIPLKTIQVEAIEETYVIPCGCPVGIYMETEGIMVIDTGTIVDSQGVEQAPAGTVLQSGDYIQAVDGVYITEKEELIQTIQESQGQSLTLTVKRNQQAIDVLITPVCSKDGDYKAGIWVRDDMQGIGTLTYVTEEEFGALGHGVNDTDTGELVDFATGELRNASIIGITKGESGQPGSVAGMVDYSEEGYLGSIESNTECGIAGSIEAFQHLPADVSQTFVPVALKQEVVLGTAYIRSDISGEMKEYEIQITDIHMGSTNATKGLEIQVTDPELLELTGGIIQGLSGSPILQNGQVVGAVTHVLVNDPTRGYGIFIENMLEHDN
ncbi:MAG: SpoIVB peptidase [Lachnospiraceae bacterium]|nr:SpoIVB peptidase [Lachnospiraceae bacterium]